MVLIMKMIALIRADASNQIGSGHIMRCLTLAQELVEKGAEVHFVCWAFPGNLIGLLQVKGITVHAIQYSSDFDQELAGTGLHDHLKWQKNRQAKDATATRNIIQNILKISGQKKIDWLIVDHYSIDAKWEKTLRPLVRKIMVIDDTAERSHDCDLLLDQNLHDNMEERYKDLVPEHCIQLLGPKYAILRPEFRKARMNLRRRDGTVKRILVFMGGADPTNETAKALEAIKLLNKPALIVDVVVGSSNPHRDEIETICTSMPNSNFYCQVDNMAELMTKADLAIGAGGSTTWERCCLGLPAIIMTLAANQTTKSHDPNLTGGQINLGSYINTSSEDILAVLKQLLNDKDRLSDMAKSAYDVMKDYSHQTVIYNIKSLLDKKVY